MQLQHMPNTHRRRDSTRQLSRVGVGGVYWAIKDRQTRQQTDRYNEDKAKKQ